VHICVKVVVIMARVTRLVLVLASGFGFAMAAPAESHAGIIPWMYDAVFGPVGSMRAGGAGYPMTAGYAPYSSGYAPYSAGYAPYYTSDSSAYMPVTTAGYSGGCSTCSQASYVPSSECSSCGSGNCSTGTCSNCTVNSAPSTSGYGSTGVSAPVPDPLNRSRDEEIRRLERKIEELDHREKQTEKFLRRQHSEYVPEQFKPSTYLDEEEVQARRKKDTFDSDSANPENFQKPMPIHRGKGAPSNLPTEEGTQKPIIPLKEDKFEKSNDGTTKSNEVAPQTLRFENRITTRAVAPRERMQIVTKQSNLSVAKTEKNDVKTSETSRGAELARK
jgi:hypothetical protein